MKVIPETRCAHFYQRFYLDCLFVWLMVFNDSFNNISVISWRSVLFRRNKPKV